MKKTFLFLALSAIFLACEKPNSSPLIKDIRVNDKTLGSEINLGSDLVLSVVAEDDNGLDRYQVNIVKGALNETSPVTHPTDFNFGNGDNISGSNRNLTIPIKIPAVVSAGAYQVQITLKDDEGKFSVQKAQTFNVINPANSIKINIDGLTPGPGTTTSNIIFTNAAEPITIIGNITSTVDIASVKFFMATKTYSILERTFEFEGTDDFTIDFKDILDEQGTQYTPYIPGNVGFGQQLEFFITAVDANGKIASRSYGIAIGTN